MKSRNWIIILLATALAVVSIRLAVISGHTDDNEEPTEDAVSGATASTGQDALDCIMTRTSVRKYSGREVPDSVVETMLRAAMAAPTALNKQPWSFIVVRKKEMLDSIAREFPNASMAAGASLAVIVCGDMSLAMDKDTPTRGNWTLDCSAATENMLLAAHALGVGAVWCGIYPTQERVDKMTKMFDLRNGIIPFAVVSVGYPEGENTPKNKWDANKVIWL